MKKLKKVFIGIIFAILLSVLLSTANFVNAEVGSLYVGWQMKRSSGYAYIMGGYSDPGRVIVGKLSSGTSSSSLNTNSTIYCIKGGAGFGSADGLNETRQYTQKFDLRQPSTISSTYSDALPSGSNYNKLMWVLDHCYVMPNDGQSDDEEKNAYLQSVIPDEYYEYMTIDDIDVAQQLAIWYFTNPDVSDKFHFTGTASLHVNTIQNDINSDYKALSEIFTTISANNNNTIGELREDAIEALFQYLITNADTNYNYAAQDSYSPITLELEDTTIAEVTSGSYTDYIAGPYKIENPDSLNVTNLTATYTDLNGNTINPTILVKNSEGNYVATSLSLTELMNEGRYFYLTVPKTSNITGIKMTISGTYPKKTLTYWSVVNAPSTDQPIVVIDDTGKGFTDTKTATINQKFDLSLRKYISAINGNAVSPNREPVVDTTNLKTGTATTATYNHTKEPIKVSIGDEVEYTIRVYNEGQIDGYVSEITDHLPAQLEYIVDNETNKQYGWSLNSATDLKTVKTAYLSKANEKTTNGNLITAYDGGNTLSYQEVKIVCKVVQTSPMANKITNIADITGFTDSNGNTVTDIDSQAQNVNLPTGTNLENYQDDAIKRGEEYIPGQQDDDDFEKIYVDFDLALRKFITGVAQTESSNITLITNRYPVFSIDSNGKYTYTHTKDPVTVETNNVVIYTIRIYNEGTTNGYAQEIKDDIPEGLEYLPNYSTNITYGWKMLDKDGNETTDVTKAVTIATDYLSKEKEKTLGSNLLSAFNASTMSEPVHLDVQVAFKVTEPNSSDRIIINKAQISEDADESGNPVDDIDSIPDEWNEGEDDQDIEKIKVKCFDLALRKFITAVNGEELKDPNGKYTRAPVVDITNLKAGTSTTAIYNHPKTPVRVSIGDTVVYTIRVYNEGDAAGYAKEITDHLPDQLEFIEDNEINIQYGWAVDQTNSKIVKTSYLSMANGTQNLIEAFDGTSLDYKDIKIACKVISTNPMPTKITNIADITDFTDSNGEEVKDRDSEEDNVEIPSNLPEYKDDEITKDYVPGQQDDDDFEKIMIKEFDLSLRKFITGINNTTITSRIPQVDLTNLKAGTSTTATYNHTKEPLKVAIEDFVTYTIRVYNEGDVDGYVDEITDHLPDQLEFVKDNEINQSYGWEVDQTNSKIIRTDYLTKSKETIEGSNLIKAFDGKELDYKEVKVVCKVVETEPMVKKITNIADITEFTNLNGEKVTDRDSEKENVNIPSDLPGYKDDEITKDYVPGQQDDDDFEKILVTEFDLALRKFITAVNTSEITDRYPVFSIDENGNYIYTHTKEPVQVANGYVVTYTIRVYNEGERAGYAQEVKDDIPEGLEFLPDNDTNKEYRWVMLDKDGKETTNIDEAESIVTDYLSNNQEKTPGENLINAFDDTTMEEPDYRDVKVAFKVTEANTSDRIIINKAQISEDADENGNPVKDKDSEPDEWNEGEDDQDIEKIKVLYFDLALRKWVTQAIVTENGQTTVTETGHTAEDDPEGVVKVEIKDKNIDSVTVKFKYKIRVTNEGEIPGYVKEIKDYIPEGLKFVAEDNTNWTQVSENVITTDQVKDVLLKPGESTEVEVILTWINGDDNLGEKINVAEISKDYNEFNAPDKDSTPDNKKEGEDDIDDAPVLLSIKTGQFTFYTTLTLAVLTIMGTGVVLIKKYVL